jgi:DNA uptake protein ComE-like DNA-binding protein
MGKKKSKRAGAGVGTLVDVAAAGLGLASLASDVLERRRRATETDRPVVEPRAWAESPGTARLGRTAKVADVALGTVHALLDLNAASPEALRTLPKIGKKRVRKILAHRPFGRVKDLKKVLPKRVYKVVKHRLTV